MGKAAVIKLRNDLRQELRMLDTLEILRQVAIAEFHYLDAERKEASRFMEVLKTFFYFYREARFEESVFGGNRSRAEAVVAITSEESFAGALNLQVIDRVRRIYEEEPSTQVIVLGRRGARRLEDMNIPAVSFAGVPFPLTYEAVEPLKFYLLEQYTENNIGRTRIIFTRCESFTRQSIEERRLLPFYEADLEADRALEAEQEAIRGMVVSEPDVKSVLDYTIALWFGRRLYEIFWDSRLSEAASRSIELSERHSRLSRRRAETLIRYFRASHEVIDSGIREVFAGHFSLRKGTGA